MSRPVVSFTILLACLNLINLLFGPMPLLTLNQSQLLSGPPVVWVLRLPPANGPLVSSTLLVRLSVQRPSLHVVGMMSPFNAHAIHVLLLHGANGQHAQKFAQLVAALDTDNVLMQAETFFKRNTVFTKLRPVTKTQFFDVPSLNAPPQLPAPT